jgi:hypothetical protein
VVATRSIVTSQPDIECDVCERRLLRGEQSDVFLAAGRRRTVCELCAPRAMHEGWLRETDGATLSVPQAPARRGRNLFGRLRQVGRPAAEVKAPAPEPAQAAESQPYDFLDSSAAPADEPSPEPAGEPSGSPRTPVATGREHPQGQIAPASGGRAERAIELFNAGEHPRRVSGVARSLGAPGVNVRPDEDVQDLVSIVIAWELCWYRYEVNLDDPDGGVRVLAQGTELGELAHEDRLVNAVADELGGLSLSGAQAG